MRSSDSVTTAFAARSIAWTRVPVLKAMLAPATPFGPAIGASWGIALPVRTAFDSGGFSYGSHDSSLSRITSAAASCCRAPSAAPTPAGPPPTITILRGLMAARDSRPERDQHRLDVLVIAGDYEHRGIGPQRTQRL